MRHDDDEREYRIFLIIAVGIVLLMLAFTAGLQIGIHHGRKLVSDREQIVMMDEVRIAAQVRAIKRLNMMGVE